MRSQHSPRLQTLQFQEGKPINVMALCAGCGGLELGISLALRYIGATSRLVCAVERECAAASSLVASMEAGWFHQAPVWSDLATFDARPWRGLVHILASGDPCQENSVAGKRAGADGERFLAPEVVRIAEECRPDIIFRENVPGNAGGQLEALVPPLERMGYRLAAGIFSSSETGNTMRRERLFIMAVRTGGGFGEFGTAAAAGRLGYVDCGSAGLGSPIGSSDRGNPSNARRNEIERAASDRPSPESQRELDGAKRYGRRPGRDHYRENDGDQPGATGGGLGALGLGNPTSPRSLPAAQQGLYRAEESSGPRDAQFERRGEPVASASGARLQGGKFSGASEGQHGFAASGPASELRGTRLPPAVIPGPTDSRWIDVLDRFPEYQPALSQEEAESHLRRGIDTLAHRTERLRATGNGVDPITAAYGFLCLQQRLSE